ncbi:MAG: Na+/H+ antiporter NhaA [Campylobacteraceae bacterium]|nr:Na+/H+ antiporter NhaA [Campylobacteraceae bacterium]
MEAVKRFFKNESIGGILIIAGTFLALLFANSFLSEFYDNYRNFEIGVKFGDYTLTKTMLLIVNDGFMALFFFYIGLEVKREVLVGQLSSPSRVALPVVGGIGGIVAPALVFIAFTYGDAFAMRGWAIPTVSDTAFAVGILLLLGSRVPPSLRMFLLLLAIIDDVCVVFIIAVFYTTELSYTALSIAAGLTAILLVLNLLKVNKKAYYIITSLLLWLAFLESGVHPTIAGIVASAFIPLKPIRGYSMLNDIEKRLGGFITYFVMPVFAFTNAGMALNADAFNHLIHPVSLGIFFGLVVAKPVGIYIASYFIIKGGVSKLPEGANSIQFFGLCVLTGIGASMSLFIGTIAYGDSDAFHYAEKLSILIASFVAAVLGFIIMKIGFAYQDKRAALKEDHDRDIAEERVREAKEAISQATLIDERVRE